MGRPRAAAGMEGGSVHGEQRARRDVSFSLLSRGGEVPRPKPPRSFPRPHLEPAPSSPEPPGCFIGSPLWFFSPFILYFHFWCVRLGSTQALKLHEGKAPVGLFRYSVVLK